MLGELKSKVQKFFFRSLRSPNCRRENT